MTKANGAKGDDDIIEDHYQHLYHIEYSNQQLLFGELSSLTAERDELSRFLGFVALHLGEKTPKPGIKEVSLECQRLMDKYRPAGGKR